MLIQARGNPLPVLRLNGIDIFFMRLRLPRIV